MKWLKKQIWLPLSGLIFGTYMIQRGLASLAKAGVADHLKEATSIMFTVAGFSALIMGMLCDNIKAKTMLIIAGIVAAIGIALLPYTALGFGLLFGAGAAIFKLVPYSNPLKRKDGNESMRMAPMASAKNFGAAFFIIVVGSIASWSGLVPITLVMSIIIVMMALIAAQLVGDDRIPGWRWQDVANLSKEWKFWLFMLYAFIMVGAYYVGVSGIYPMLVKTGLTKTTALMTLGGSFIIAGLLRWPWAYIGKRTEYYIPMIVGTIGVIGSTLMIKADMILGFPLFILSGAAHTPNYWAYAKEQWGSKLVATVMGLAMVAMYFGAGIIYGKW